MSPTHTRTRHVCVLRAHLGAASGLAVGVDEGGKVVDVHGRAHVHGTGVDDKLQPVEVEHGARGVASGVAGRQAHADGAGGGGGGRDGGAVSAACAVEAQPASRRAAVRARGSPRWRRAVVVHLAGGRGRGEVKEVLERRLKRLAACGALPAAATSATSSAAYVTARIARAAPRSCACSASHSSTPDVRQVAGASTARRCQVRMQGACKAARLSCWAGRRTFPPPRSADPRRNMAAAPSA
jgi:hypothetical protein